MEICRCNGAGLGAWSMGLRICKDVKTAYMAVSLDEKI
jgi:hypothetical protein